MPAALRYKLYRTEPAYPPRAGPCGPPSLSPPARGDHETGVSCVRLPAATFPLAGFESLWGTPPTPPGCGLRPRGRRSAAKAECFCPAAGAECLFPAFGRKSKGSRLPFVGLGPLGRGVVQVGVCVADV